MDTDNEFNAARSTSNIAGKSNTNQIDTDTVQSETGMTTPKKDFFSSFKSKKNKKQEKKEYAKEKRDNETDADRKARLKRLSENEKKRIENESEEDRKARLKRLSENEKKRIGNEAEEDRKARLKRLSENEKKRIENESELERKKRLQKKKENKQKGLIDNNEKFIEKKERIEKQKKERQEKKKQKDDEYIEEFLNHRKKYQDSLKNSSEKSDKQLNDYFSLKHIGNNQVCFCCCGLFHPRQVEKQSIDKILDFAEKKWKNNEITKNLEFKRTEIRNRVFNYNSETVCRTCAEYIRQSKIPKLAADENLRFQEIPECLKRLSPLEQIMCSPYIGFKKIIELLPYSLNPQLGILQGIINIEVDVQKMVTILPRSFTDLEVMKITLKRRMEHKTSYKCEVIRPANIIEALKYLVGTPLYKANNIVIDQIFLSTYSKRADVELNLTINDQDEITVEEIMDFYEDMEMSSSDESADDSEDENILPENETLLYVPEDFVVENKEKESNAITIAPGQDQRPIPSYMIKNLDELIFPREYGGYPIDEEERLTYQQRIKYETRHVDGRHRNTTRLLHMAKRTMENQIRNAKNIYLRKMKSNRNLTAKDVRNNDTLQQIVRNDRGYVDYSFTKQCRKSPAFSKVKRFDLISMVQQMGTPHLFITVSLSETKNPELLAILHEVAGLGKICAEDAMRLPLHQKTQLIQDNPVAIVEYFEEMLKNIKRLMTDPEGPFGDKCVVDFYIRKEFQQRGSVHAHMLLWLKNTPTYDKDKSNAELIEVIDELMTCSYVPQNPLMSFQRHKHTPTCYKSKNSKKVCRFHYPKYVMPRTMILEPLRRLDVKDKNEWYNLKGNIQRINEKMNAFFEKNITIDFNDMLNELDISESDYVRAIRTTTQNSTVFLKRSSLEVAINAYTPFILNITESNTDTQYILNPYACIVYITNYITKGDTGLSKALQLAEKSLDKSEYSVSEKLNRYANEFIRGSLIGAQEAVYLILSLPISDCSIATVYIDTRPTAERTRRLKSKDDLNNILDESTDIFEKNIFHYYVKRHAELDNVCLADFATEYVDKVTRNEAYNCDNEAANKRQKRKILKYYRHKEDDAPNYFRENILLFLPWRNERNEIEHIDQRAIFLENIELIQSNKAKYNIITSTDIELAKKQLKTKEENDEDESQNDDQKDEIFDEYDVSPTSKNKKRSEDDDDDEYVPKTESWNKPDPLPEVDVMELMTQLNAGQREFVMHVYHSFKTKQLPMRIFLSGSAGTGKSFVIKTLFHLITQLLQKETAGTVNPENDVVLLTATTGIAAHLIGGNTIHNALKITPATKHLSADKTNTLQIQFHDLQLNICDEMSMMGATLFYLMEYRYQLLKGSKESFGGISIILVGDLFQLPPVKDQPIYCVPQNSELARLVTRSSAWDEFELFELTEIMRQKDERDFIQALNNIAHGTVTEEDRALLETRVVKSEDIDKKVPKNCLRLFNTNIQVDNYNWKRIQETPGELHSSTAKDRIISSHLSEKNQQHFMEMYQKKPKTETQGLPTAIVLKINIRYIITKNINVSDGLANGVTGILKHITFITKNDEQVPKTLWFDFQSKKIGMAMKSNFAEKMKRDDIEPHLVPIEKVSIQEFGKNQSYTITRKQFPVSPAEAMTVHKSQGCTYNQICVDLANNKFIQTAMVYVAYSRVTSLEGLFIVDRVTIPTFTKSGALDEMDKLRSSKQLKLSYEKYIIGDEIKIVYQNLNSLQKKLKFIVCDEWYKQADFLIFAETYTCPKQIELDIPGFKIIYRHDSNDKQSGLVCYISNALYAKYKDLQFTSRIESGGKKGAKFHQLLIHFCFEDIHIITGYKSPRTPIATFKKHLEKLITDKIDINSINVKAALLGDFNQNTIEKDSDLEKYLNNFGFIKALDEQVTTNNDTQIDVIHIKNIQHYHCGAYETYFSHHKPIFLGISSVATSNKKNPPKRSPEDEIEHEAKKMKKEPNEPMDVDEKTKASSIQPSQNQILATRKLGFYNTGSSCWANAIMQCFLNLKSMHDLFELFDDDDDIHHLRAVFNEYTNVRATNKSITDALTELRKHIDEEWAENVTRDVTEVMIAIFDRYAVLKNLFDFDKITYVECPGGCTNSRHMERESINVLYLPRNNQCNNIQQLLDANLTDISELENDCAVCGARKFQTHTIENTSDVMIIQLQLGKANPNPDPQRPETDFIKEMNFKVLENIAHQNIKVNNESYEYSGSIFYHGGPLLNDATNHYTAVLRQNGTLIKADDSIITSPSDWPNQSKDLYVLFYVKTQEVNADNGARPMDVDEEDSIQNRKLGFINTGNSCWANALMQCFLHLKSIRDSFGIFDDNADIAHLKAIFDEYASDRATNESITYVLMQMRRHINENWARNIPRDLLEVIYTIIRKYSILKRVFGFEMAEYETCRSGCTFNRYSRRKPIYTLYLPESNQCNNIQDLLDRNQSHVNEIEDSLCDQCGGQLAQTRVIENPSDVIIIYLELSKLNPNPDPHDPESGRIKEMNFKVLENIAHQNILIKNEVFEFSGSIFYHGGPALRSSHNHYTAILRQNGTLIKADDSLIISPCNWPQNSRDLNVLFYVKKQ